MRRLARLAPHHQSGQAAVEAALTLPLVIFLVLGTLQLFVLAQARILAQYAASRATRLGALNHANCNAIVEPAIAILLPAITARFSQAASPGVEYADQVRDRLSNRYLPLRDGGLSGPIVWVERVRPLMRTIDPALEEETWNLAPPAGPRRVLEVRLWFWAPLKIPFANWVFSRLALANWGLLPYDAVDPLMPARTVTLGQVTLPPSARVGTELRRRYANGELVFPIQATYAMRMMSPARMARQHCQ